MKNSVFMSLLALLTGCSGIDKIGDIPSTTIACWSIYDTGPVLATGMILCTQGDRAVAATGGAAGGVLSGVGSGVAAGAGAVGGGAIFGTALGGVLRGMEGGRDR